MKPNPWLTRRTAWTTRSRNTPTSVDALDEHGVDAALNEHEVEAALDVRDVEDASEYEVAEKKRKAKARQPNYVSFSSLVIVSDSFCLVTNICWNKIHLLAFV